MRNKKVITIVAAILLAAVYILIFMFSSDNAESSSDISLKVTEALVNFYYRMIGSGGEEMLLPVIVSAENSVRKLAHFLEYMAVGFLSYGIAVMWIKNRAKGFMLVVFQLIISAGIDEIHQYFVPGRHASVKDVLLDTAGGIVGMLIILGMKGIQRAWNHIQKRESKTYS